MLHNGQLQKTNYLCQFLLLSGEVTLNKKKKLLRPREFQNEEGGII